MMNDKALPDVLSLSGQWEWREKKGFMTGWPVSRGLVTDPREINDGDVWYKKILSLPDGDWTQCYADTQRGKVLPRRIY